MASLAPVARFSFSPPSPSTHDAVHLRDCSHDPREVGIAWRVWDFGDGTTSVGVAPVHRYARRGVYEVTLTLATFDGRLASEAQEVKVGG